MKSNLLMGGLLIVGAIIFLLMGGLKAFGLDPSTPSDYRFYGRRSS